VSMTGSPGYLDIAGLSAAIGPLGRKGRGSGKISICLLAETLIATCSVILVIRLLALGSVHEVQWFLGPVVLVVAAMVPAVAGRSSFPRIAPGTGQLRGVVVEFCRVCLAVLPVSFAVLWLLYWWGLGAPLGGAVPHGRGWLAFVLYQFIGLQRGAGRLGEYRRLCGLLCRCTRGRLGRTAVGSDVFSGPGAGLAVSADRLSAWADSFSRAGEHLLLHTGCGAYLMAPEPAWRSVSLVAALRRQPAGRSPY